jgi:hypothetical protein
VNTSQRAVLEQWRNGFHLHQDCHYDAAKRVRGRGRILGGFVILLSALVGAAVFRSIAESLGTNAKIALGLMSVVAGTLGALQTFLDYPGLAERHRTAAVEYGDLRRELDRLIATEDTSDVDDQMSSVQKRWHEVDSAAPEIPPRILKNGPSRLLKRKEAMSPFREPPR